MELKLIATFCIGIEVFAIVAGVCAVAGAYRTAIVFVSLAVASFLAEIVMILVSIWGSR